MELFENFFEDPDKFIYEDEKQKFIEHMDFLKTMSVQESTLYKKWKEFNHNDYEIRQKASKIHTIKPKLWKPTNLLDRETTLAEIQSIKPKIIPIKQGDSRQNEYWTLIRRLIHTMEFTANPGRNVKFIVMDETSNKILGVICLGSDVIAISARDSYIGWSKDNKLTDGKLKNSTIATTICSTQPFGFNFLGGKLIAALISTKTFREQWEELYGEKLAGVTTTSLYGIHSMYNGIPYWKTLGESAGRISLKPDDDFFQKWHDWYKDNKSEKYAKHIQSKDRDSGPVTGVKQRILNLIFQELGIKTTAYEHGFKRGVFYLTYYENSREYLRGEISESELRLKPRFEQDIDGVMDWWKKKACKRYEKLLTSNKLKDDILFYGDIIGLDWEQTREKYIGEVGR